MRSVRVLIPLALCAALLAPVPALAAAEVAFNRTALVLGQTVRIELRNVPNRAGQPVRLQEKLDGAWATIQQKRVGTDGKATFWETPDTLGAHWYRLYLPPTADRSGLVSTQQAVQVRRWRYLRNFAPASTSGPQATPIGGSATIDGHAFPNSVRFAGSDAEPSVTQWTIPQRCVEFRATFGLHAGSDEAAQAEIVLKVDGQVRDTGAEGPFGTLDRRLAVQEIYGNTTLRIEHTEVEPEAQPALGDARFLCAS